MRIKLPIRLMVAVVMVFAGMAGAIYLASEYSDLWPNKRMIHAMSWRAQLFFRKATGNVQDLSWTELWELSRPAGGFGLESMIVYGESAIAAASNIYVSREDQEAGAQIFNNRCAICHGANGGGISGPPLTRSGLKNGDTDLEIYRVLRDGVAGTAMASPKLSFVERWQVISFIRKLESNTVFGDTRLSPRDIRVSTEQIQASDRRPDEWLTYSGSLSGQRYTALTDITPANVSQLRLRWIYQLSTNEPKVEATPLVAGEMIFTTVPPASVIALDAKTGDLIWTYERRLPTKLSVCCGIVNRGLAILGNAVFFGSLDGYLVAINANNGHVIWQTQVASPSDGYAITVAPLVVNSSVIVGVAGGEFGIRGFLAAFDATTGQLQWKFNTIPEPGEAGHETWDTDAWKHGGGPTWVTGSYDPSLDLLYWGVGNPSPSFSGDRRSGDNLFTDSVIALHATTGKLAWYFQFTPHDERDWDSAQTPILADILFNGTNRKVICWPNRNGFYYVLDRATGEFLVGTPFVEQNWTQGLTSAGRPLPAKEGDDAKTGRITKPSVAGGRNWQPAAFDPRKGLVFVPAIEGQSVFTKAKTERRGDDGTFVASGGSIIPPISLIVRALDVSTGVKRWDYPSSQGNATDHGGLLSTGAGLVFGTANKFLFALDSANGNELWRIFLGGGTWGPPISFALDGRQVIVVTAGKALFMFAL